MSKHTPNLLEVTEDYVNGAVSRAHFTGGFLMESTAQEDFDRWLEEWTRVTRNQVIDEAVEVINDAREEGEGDLRQVRHHIEQLKVEA